MSTTTLDGVSASGPLTPPGAGGRWQRLAGTLVRAVPLVQALVTLLGAVGVLLVFVAGPRNMPPPVFALAIALPAGFTAAAGLSTLWTLQRSSRGRVMAIIVDYLVVLALVMVMLHLADAFIGLDGLADTFGATLPWLGVGLLAFVLGYLTEPLQRRPGALQALQLIRLALFAIAALGALFAIDALRGVLGLASSLTDPLQLALGLALVVLATVVVALWGTAGRAHYGATLRHADILFGVLLVSPNVIGFLAFFAGPLLFSLYVSLTEWNAFSDPAFLGLQNYIDILALQVVVIPDPSAALAPGLDAGFTEILRLGSVVIAAQDKLFWTALRNIVLFSLIAIPLAVVPALFLASLLNSKLRGVRVFRAIYFIPSVAGVVGVAIIWKRLLDQTVGWVNHLITMAVDGLNSLFGLGLVDPKIGWLSDPATALPIIAVVFAWTVVGFNAILFLAGLQGIPADLYEAASIDGANRWQRFRAITLPSVAPTTFFVVATTSILALQLFTEPYVLTSPNPGGPGTATLTPVMYLYNSGFKNFEFGYSSAIAWCLFAIIFVFTLVQYRRQRAGAEAL